MESDDRLRIQGNRKDIVNNVNVSDVVDHLIQFGQLTDEEHEYVSMRGITRQDGVRRLLKIIQKKPNGFDAFCKSLEEAYDWLAEQIRSTDPSTVTQPDEADGQDDKINQLNSQLWMQTQLIQRFKEDIDNLKLKVQVQDQQYEVIKQKFDQAMQFEGITKQITVDQYLKDYIEKKDHPNRAALECPDGLSVDTEPALRRGSMGNPSDLTEAIARHLAVDVVRYMAQGEKGSPPPSNKYAKVMRAMVTEVTERHHDFFVTLLDKLNINEMNGYDTLTQVADEMFNDAVLNWGRIVTLYGFGGYLAKSTTVPNEILSTMIGDFLGFYVTTKLTTWIEEAGGWEAFMEYFSKERDEKSTKQFWQGVVYLAVFGAVSIGTIHAVVNRT